MEVILLGLTPGLFIREQNSEKKIFKNKRTSLVVQTVKSLPAMRETRVLDPLEKEMATRSNVLA